VICHRCGSGHEIVTSGPTRGLCHVCADARLESYETTVDLRERMVELGRWLAYGFAFLDGVWHATSLDDGSLPESLVADVDARLESLQRAHRELADCVRRGEELRHARATWKRKGAP
jgi:hypothetical protein